MNAAHQINSMENPLDRSLARFMQRHNDQWIARDRIMHCCGFDSPKDHPVGAYVQFQNSLIRVNRHLVEKNQKICMSADGIEIYKLCKVEVEQC